MKFAVKTPSVTLKDLENQINGRSVNGNYVKSVDLIREMHECDTLKSVLIEEPLGYK